MSQEQGEQAWENVSEGLILWRWPLPDHAMGCVMIKKSVFHGVAI